MGNKSQSIRKDSIHKSYNSIFGFMEFVGIYPPEKPPKFYKLRSYILFSIEMVVLLALILISLISTLSFNMDTFYGLIFWQNMSMTCLKMLPFLVRGMKIKKCINYFGHSRFIPREEEAKKLTEFCVKLCRTTCHLFLGFLVLCDIFWFVPLFFEDEKLPIGLWLPYDHHSNKFVFWSTFFGVSQATLFCAFCSATLDCTIATLPFHATTQLKILKHNLQHLNGFIPEMHRNEDIMTTITLEQAKKQLLSCIKLHKDILYFVAEFEDCFSWSILCQMTGSALSICTCCLTISMVPPSSHDFLTCAATAYLIMWQILFYCLFGTLLHEENNTLMDAICEGPWYRYDTRIRKMLFIVMERCKKPLRITVGKVVPLSFDVFISIMKMTYSLMTVMQQFEK